MCRMGYYFLTVKRRCKHRMDVIASLAINRINRNYLNTPIKLCELRLYLDIPVTVENTKLMIYSQSDML